MQPAEHLSYVSIRTETDGSVLGTPRCEICGPIGPTEYMDDHETELRQIAAEHRTRPT